MDQLKHTLDLAEELTVAAGRTVERSSSVAPSDSQAPEKRELAAQAEVTRELAVDLHVYALQSFRELEHLSSHLTQVVHESIFGDRRRHPRYRVDAATSVVFGERTESARIVNISRGGAKIDLAINRPVGTPVLVRLEGMDATLTAELVRVTEDGTQLRFVIGEKVAEKLNLYLLRIATPGRSQA
jgi:hypothetical protein